MPTPIGHALGGLATAWTARAVTRRPHRLPQRTQATLIAWCVAAAVSADIDILFNSHRSYTHSVGATLVVGVAAWLIARRSHNDVIADRAHSIGLTIATAYGTHVLLDWLGKDTAPPFGLLALWPFSMHYYISGMNVFMEISRRYWKPDEFIVGNLKAGAWELLVLGPAVLLAWKLQKRSRT